MARRTKLDKQLDELAAKFIPRIRKAFLASVADIKSTAILTAIIDAIKVGDIEAAFRATGLSTAAMRPISAMIETAYEAGGVTVANSAPRGITDLYGSRAIFRFDVRNSRAEAWARDNSSSLVTIINDDTRANIRALIQQGILDGRNPRNTALDIIGRINPDTGRREGGIVGLNEPQARWVMNARRDLNNLDPHYFTREQRDKRFDSIVRKAIANDKPLTGPKIDALIDRYSDNLLQQRGETIARTESLQALNKAAFEAFAQAIEQGTLQPGAVTKTWDSAGDDRVRHTHRIMNDKVAQFDEPFTTPFGAKLMFPGDISLGAPGSEIINCRCRVRYAVDWFADLDDDPTPLPSPPPVPIETIVERNARLDNEQRDYTLTNGRTQNIEFMTAYDEISGSVFGRNVGTRANVTFTPELAAAINDPKRKIILHHNHPSSSSFSDQDLYVLNDARGLKGLWAHGHNGTSYYAELGKRKIDKKVIQSALYDVQRAIQAAYRVGEINPTQLKEIGMNHIIARYLERTGRLGVYRVEGSETISAGEQLVNKILKRLGI